MIPLPRRERSQFAGRILRQSANSPLMTEEGQNAKLRLVETVARRH